MQKKIEQLALSDERYSPQAVSFVYEGICYTIRQADTEDGHVSAKDLCFGLAKLAVEKWGRLAILVLNSGGIRKTRDFGEIVYLLAGKKLIATSPSDNIEDFDDIYDFKTFFKDKFKF
jgi:uncharacterized repeat protein (TIGR04138 family)